MQQLLLLELQEYELLWQLQLKQKNEKEAMEKEHKNELLHSEKKEEKTLQPMQAGVKDGEVKDVTMVEAEKKDNAPDHPTLSPQDEALLQSLHDKALKDLEVGEHQEKQPEQSMQDGGKNEQAEQEQTVDVKNALQQVARPKPPISLGLSFDMLQTKIIFRCSGPDNLETLPMNMDDCPNLKLW